MKKYLANELTVLTLVVVLAGILLYWKPDHALSIGLTIVALISLLTAIVISKQRYPGDYAPDRDDYDADEDDREADYLDR